MKKTYRFLGVAAALIMAANANAGAQKQANYNAVYPVTEVAGPSGAAGTTRDIDLIIRLKDLIANQFDIKPSDVTMETNFAIDLGADSLDMAEIIMDCEKEFSIEISDKAAEKFVYVINLYDYLRDNSRWDI